MSGIAANIAPHATIAVISLFMVAFSYFTFLHTAYSVTVLPSTDVRFFTYALFL